MEPSRLREALGLLRRHYGEPADPGPVGRWRTLVRIVLEHGATGEAKAGLDTALQSELLLSPDLVVRAGRAELAEAMAGVQRARQKAPALQALAWWWLDRCGEGDAAEWEESTETLRAELLSIRGVSVELADRLLLFVVGRSVYPVDRASVRVTVRHGWLGPEAEYDEWQAQFVQGLDRESGDLQRISLWLRRIGQDFCGPAPRCEACPLRPLLPPAGPCAPE